MNKIFNNIKNCIEKSNSILITSHMDPDGDSLGSMLAIYNYVRYLDKEAVILNHGEVPWKYEFFPMISNINNVKEYKENKEFDLVIILECPTPQRCGDVTRYITDKTKIINIDHHPDNSGYGDVVYVDDKASAVGEILAEFFLDINYTFDADIASVLYAAILTDTGRFRFDSTSKRTMEIAGYLIESGADPRTICDNIYYSQPSRILQLTGKILSGLELYADGKICMILLDRKMMNGNKYNASDSEGMAEFSMYDRNVLIGGFLREINDNVTKISLRSRKNIDVSSLAHKYGGGGHVNASGFTVSLPLVQAQEKLLVELKEMINNAV